MIIMRNILKKRMIILNHQVQSGGCKEYDPNCLECKLQRHIASQSTVPENVWEVMMMVVMVVVMVVVMMVVMVVVMMVMMVVVMVIK